MGEPYGRWARYYDAIYSFKDYAAEARMIDDLVRERVPGARTLLDVGCGTGKHLEQWAAAYEEVEGLDLEESLLAVARSRLPGIRLHHADMRAFDLGRRFEVVTCMFSGIGHMPSVGDLRLAIRAMARHLREGGILVVEPWLTPDAVRARHVGARFVDEPELKIARLDRSRVEGRRLVLELHYLVGTPDRIDSFVETLPLTLFTDEEYREALAGAGLEALERVEGPMGRGLYLARRGQGAARG